MMTELIIFLSVLISVSTSIFIINISLDRLIRKKLKSSDEFSMSTCINSLKASLFISIALLVGEINISLHNISKMLNSNQSNYDLFFQIVSYFSIFIFITYLLFTYMY